MPCPNCAKLLEANARLTQLVNEAADAMNVQSHVLEDLTMRLEIVTMAGLKWKNAAEAMLNGGRPTACKES